MYNLAGVQIFNLTINGTTAIVDNNLINGIYLVRITSKLIHYQKLLLLNTFFNKNPASFESGFSLDAIFTFTVCYWGLYSALLSPRQLLAEEKVLSNGVRSANS